MNTNQPTVSIIIPCYNEAKWIDACLRSVIGFEPIDLKREILVVDGMSKDSTRDILAQWQAKLPNLRVLDNPGKIVPKAMNIGIQAAHGEWIVRLDAHSTYPVDYLQRCVETSQRTSAENVGGVVISVPRSEQPEAKLIQALTTHRFGVGNSTFRLEASEGPADTVPFGCYRREVFERIGLYDERLVRNQDYELNRRLLRSGGRIWLNPEIQVQYRNQDTLRGLLRQAVFTGQWNPWMWYVAPYTFAPRHAIPGVFVLGLLYLASLSFIFDEFLLLIGAALGSYFIGAVLSAVQQSHRFGWWMLPILPFLFLAYHISYGIGTLCGLLLLAVRRAPINRTST